MSAGAVCGTEQAAIRLQGLLSPRRRPHGDLMRVRGGSRQWSVCARVRETAYVVSTAAAASSAILSFLSDSASAIVASATAPCPRCKPKPARAPSE